MKRSSGQRARRFQSILAAALCVAAAGKVSAATLYDVEIVNQAPSSIVAFDVAPAGSRHFRSALHGNAALPGNGGSGVIAIRAGDGCLRDLRVRFADGRVVARDNFDLCAIPGDAGDDPTHQRRWTVRTDGPLIGHGNVATP